MLYDLTVVQFSKMLNNLGQILVKARVLTILLQIAGYNEAANKSLSLICII